MLQLSAALGGPMSWTTSLSEFAEFITLKRVYPAGTPGSPDLVRFGQEGGLIGRGSQCSWVLNDPERVISKEHAKIIFRNGAFCVVGLGRNGVYMNGGATPLDADVPTMLKTGDRLRLGRTEIVVEEIAAPASAAAPRPAAGPQSTPAVDAGRRLSEEWEARLGELLRTSASTAPAGSTGVEGATARPTSTGVAETPASMGLPALGPLVDLPPPTVTLAPEQQRPAAASKAGGPVGEALTEWNREGPLSSLLLGREAPPPDEAGRTADAALPPARPEPLRIDPGPVAMPTDPVPTAPPFRMNDYPREDYGAPPLPPDAAFLRGIGIGLPQVSAAQAAVIAYDLGRALAALADLMVEASHRQEPPGAAPSAAGPFAALPTGSLALSDLVASPDYRPGQIERTVREAIALTRRLQGGAPGEAGIDVATLAPAALMRRWNLDARRRDSAARAWALYESRFPELIAIARNGHDATAEPANRLSPMPRTRVP